MRPRHLPAVVELEHATNSHPWSARLFRNELDHSVSRRYLVALLGVEVVGFGGLMQTSDEGHITTLAVAPAHRRRGIASRLLIDLLTGARASGVVDATLEVRMSNAPARELYRRFGFAPEGVRPRYYRSPVEDALILWARSIDSEDARARLDRLRRGADVPDRR